MRVKRFRGSSVDGLLKQIKAELGSDVQLLETRSVRRPGLLGLVGPREMEISVAFEEGAAPADSPRGPVPTRTRARPIDRRDEKRREAPPDGGAGGPDAAGPAAPGIIDALRRRGVPGEAAELLAARLSNGRRLEDLPWMRAVPISAAKEEPGPRVIALVGPTGSGKTTTCAKLAAQMSLSRGYHVGLITSDTYRIGAVEQLRKYAKILQVGFEVVFDPEEMAGALRRLGHADLVLVDTAGHNPRDDERLRRLDAFLRSVDPDEVHLVVSAGVNVEDGRSLVQRYRGIGFNRLLVTKLDETGRPGRVIPLAEAAGVPLSYICDGQEVPDDVGLASQILSETLLEGMVP